MKNWKIAGLAGGGIAVTGTIFAKVCMRHGLSVFTYGEYPSLIRGGHNTIQVSFDKEEVTTQQKNIDVLIALNADGITLHKDELSSTSSIIVDKTQVKLDWDTQNILGNIIDLPMHKLALDITGSTLSSNMVGLGASMYLLGLDMSILNTLISEVFEKKGEGVIKKNQLAAQAGFDHLKTQNIPMGAVLATSAKKQLYLSGTEAIGLGALSSGIQFYAAYPMTPASSLLTFLADQQAKYPIVVKHSEDEISAINQAIGASFAGVRAMVGTSGGGFALMVESVSLAAITEIPLVVLMGMRPGPATGLPTWTGQADLQFVLSAGHGDFRKIVLAPGDLEEAFRLTRLSFILAEQYHTQVYILTDKYLLESSGTVAQFESTYKNNRFNIANQPLPTDGTYKRYELTDSGYSPRSLPGMPHGIYLANSYEHDEVGFGTEEADMTQKMVDKRERKFSKILSLLPPPQIIGGKDAEITFVEWGSTKLVIEEAIKQLNQVKPNTANAIHINCMAPFHADEFTVLAKQSKRLVIVEGNMTRQAERLIRENTGITFAERINRYDGRPFYAEDIISYVKGVK